MTGYAPFYKRALGTDAALQGSARPGRQVGMAPLHLLEDRHRAQARCGHQHRYDLGIEEVDQRIRTAPAAWLLLRA